MLVVGTLLMINQQLSIGQFIAAEIVILLVLNSVEKLIINLGSVYDTLTAVEKIAEIPDKPLEKNGDLILPQQDQGIRLDLNGVRFSYDGKRNVLNNVSFGVAPNEKIGITGMGGSGKSTLIKLLTGSYGDFEGSILVDEVPIGNYNLDSLRAQTGVVLGQQEIFNGTLWDNITLGNDQLDMETVQKAVNRAGLNSFIATLKDGYDTSMDSTGGRLPRTVIQRILLARAFAGRPRLLLLEEPWLNMPEDQRQKLVDELISLSGTTVIVSTNDPAVLSSFDKIVVLDENGHTTMR